MTDSPTLAALAALAETTLDLTETTATINQHRNRLIATARAEGHPLQAIADAAGITRQRVYQLTERGTT